MGTAQKVDFPPLLAPGRHFLTLDELRIRCVRRFSSREIRRRLYLNFEQLVQEILSHQIACHIVIDGSFLTEKPEPADIDFLISIDSEQYGSLPAKALELLQAIGNFNYIDKQLDGWLYIYYPRGHSNYEASEALFIELMDLFSLEHSGNWLKGVAVLRLGESDVGLRLPA